MYRFLFTGLLIISSFALKSEKFFSLEDCINYALENNIQIKQQKLQAQVYNNNLKMSKAQRFPDLSMGGGQNFTFGRSVDPFTNEFATDNVSSLNMSIGSSVTLFNGFKKHNNVRKSHIDHKASLLELEQTKNNIVLMITSAFLNVLYNMELKEIANSQIEISQQQLERTEKLVNSGSLPVQSIYEIEAQLSTEEYNLVNINNTLNASLLNLAHILEIDDYENFNIIAPDLDLIRVESNLPNVKQVYNQAMYNMPQIHGAELRAESAYLSIKMAKADRLPRLTLSASYGTGYSNARKMIDDVMLGHPEQSGLFRIVDDNQVIFDVYQFSTDYSYKTRPFNDQIRDNASASLGVGLTIPIFTGRQIKTNIDNSKIFYKQALLQEKQIKKDLLQEIQQAHSDALAAFKQYNAAEKTLQAVELSFQYTEQRFNVGLLNTVDYNIAKNNLLRAESELVRAKYDFVFRQKIIDFYRGENIKL